MSDILFQLSSFGPDHVQVILNPPPSQISKSELGADTIITVPQTPPTDMDKPNLLKGHQSTGSMRYPSKFHTSHSLSTSLKWLTVAMPLLETSVRLVKD